MSQTPDPLPERAALCAAGRQFMKSGFDLPERDFPSDQERGVPLPPMELPLAPGQALIDLPPAAQALQAVDEAMPPDWSGDLFACLERRRSQRSFADAPLSLAALSFMLYATQGVQKIIPAYKRTGSITLRPVPSAGGRHAFETYLAVIDVAGLEPGIYRYQPTGHQLAFCHPVENLGERIARAYGGELYMDEARWLARAPVVFLWACVPGRGEWRYQVEAHRLMLLDVGHVCQNLYLASERVGCGACAIAAYVQTEMDALLGLDGQDAFVTYLAAVGQRKR